MKSYTTTANGDFTTPEGATLPKSAEGATNLAGRAIAEMRELVATGGAELIPHVEPVRDHTDLREYPPIGEQLDYIYHNGVEAWKEDMIKPIKEKWPKT